MGDILRIYSGGAQVSLYDSTNGLLALGYSGEEISIEVEPQIVPVSDGNKVQIEQIVSFEATILETDTTQITNLMARKGYLQEVYIVGIDSAYKFRDCFIKIKKIRPMKSGETHIVTISGQRYKQSVSAIIDLPETNYCQFIQNILGGYGAMLGAGTLATGWTNLGATSLSLDTSHLGGGFGNEQRLTLSDAGDFIMIRVRFPLNEVPIKLTVSAYIDNRKGSESYLFIGIITRNAAAQALDTKKSDEITIEISEDGRESYTVEFIPSAAVQFIEMYIQGSATGSAELGIDNAQLEIGSLTDYVENA